MSEKRHVVRDDDGWAIKKPGAERVSGRHDGRDEALERAREIVANAGGGSVVVHGDDGQIERVEKVERGEAGAGSSPTSSGDGRGGGDSTPPRDDDGKFVAGSDGGGATPSRDEDGKFVAGNGKSTRLRDVAASVLGGRGGTGEGGSPLPETLDRDAVVDKVAKGARSVASALGTAGKIGASAAVVAASTAVEKGRQRSEAARAERARRETARETSDLSADTTAESDDRSGPTHPTSSARSADVHDDASERSEATVDGLAAHSTRAAPAAGALETARVGLEPGSHDVETHGQGSVADEHATAGVEGVGGPGSPVERADRTGDGAAAGLDARSPSSSGPSGGASDAVPMPARRSRLLGPLFDRVRGYLGAGDERSRPDRGRTSGDAAGKGSADGERDA